jgi:hypothetical protein
MDALTKWSAPVAAEVNPRLTFKQLALLALACIAALSGSGYGYYWWTTGRFIESTDDAYVGGNVTPISPHIAGFVAEILVFDNQRVDAGQVLVRLDDRDVRAAADHAEAVLSSAQRCWPVCAPNTRYSNPRLTRPSRTLMQRQPNPVLRSWMLNGIEPSRFRIPVPDRMQREHVRKIRGRGQPSHRRKLRSLRQISS